MSTTASIRNIAIIAHVDHGKTTLVDQMLRQAGAFRANQQVEERVMDSNPLERERGITILAKNTAVRWHGTKINIVDTPGPRRLRRRGRAHPAHGGRRADPGGRGRGADAADPVRHPEGAGARAPADRRDQQDRPAGRRAAPGARRGAGAVHRSRGDATSSSTRRSSTPRAAHGTATTELDQPGTDLRRCSRRSSTTCRPPTGDPEGPFQMLISTLDFSTFLGRLAIGRIERGRVQVGDQVALLPLGEPGMVADEAIEQSRVTKLFTFDGLDRVEVEEAGAGDIVVARRARGHRDRQDAHRDRSTRSGCAGIAVEEPTISVDFIVNNSPVRRPGREVRHQPPGAGPAVQGAGAQRGAPGRGHRQPRHAARSPAAASCTSAS